MSLFSKIPEPGTVVKARQDFQATLADSVFGRTSIKKGSQGVVISSLSQGLFNSTIVVEFNGGLTGPVSVNAPLKYIRSTNISQQKNFKIHQFKLHLKFAVYFVIIASFLWSLGQYYLATGTFKGYVWFFIDSLFFFALDFLDWLVGPQSFWAILAITASYLLFKFIKN